MKKLIILIILIMLVLLIFGSRQFIFAQEENGDQSSDENGGGCSEWKTTAIFVPKGVQIVKSKFNQAKYDKFHEEPLGYECEYVIELISEKR